MSDYSDLVRRLREVHCDTCDSRLLDGYACSCPHGPAADAIEAQARQLQCPIGGSPPTCSAGSCYECLGLAVKSFREQLAEKNAEIESWKRGCRNAEQRMETAMDNAVRAQADAERLKRDLDQAVHVRDVFATGLVAAAAQIVDKDPQ